MDSTDQWLMNMRNTSNRTAKGRGQASTVKLMLLASVLFFVNVDAVKAQEQAPELFTYEELVQLYEQKNPPQPLLDRLNRLRSTPFVSNAAAARGVRPLIPNIAALGKCVRLVEWNIERGLEYDAIKLAFTDPEGFAQLLDAAEYPPGSEKRQLIMQQVDMMKQADVIVLNEVDWGMKRTDYRNVVAELATALGMNYAYGVEFVEVDPTNLGIEKFEELPPDKRAKVAAEIKVDTSLYKGLHGNAILSRFSLENVRLRPFTYQAHDWYADEIKSVSPLEEGKRKAGEKIFHEKILREVRRGGRMMLTAEITDPQIPGGSWTIVATHLEDKTKPAGRRKQLEELLAQVKDAKTAVVVAGDMNTSTQDLTPTSVARELKNRLGSKSFWLKEGLEYMAGIKLPALVLGGLNAYRRQADPTVRSVPLVGPNPEAEFFDRLKDFRFGDGGAFDFRGERERSVDGKGEPLANSNQRADKGFVTTCEVERPLGFVGKFKLDWIFAKPPALTQPYANDQPHRFAPHFGRTLRSLNQSFKGHISDHAPIMVDLPLSEPRIGESH